MLPFIHVIAASFATVEEVISKKFILIPTTFSLDAYRYIFSTDIVYRSLIVSILVTAVGTAVSMFLSSLMAYGLSRKELMGRRVLMFLVVFTMLFSGGMIPTFLVVKSLGLLDTYWSLILPTAINAFNLIILKNFFQNIPSSLEESAKIDGCNDIGIFFRIILPLSLPAIATISLFYAGRYDGNGSSRGAAGTNDQNGGHCRCNHTCAARVSVYSKTLCKRRSFRVN